MSVIYDQHISKGVILHNRRFTCINKAENRYKHIFVLANRSKNFIGNTKNQLNFDKKNLVLRKEVDQELSFGVTIVITNENLVKIKPFLKKL